MTNNNSNGYRREASKIGQPLYSKRQYQYTPIGLKAYDADMIHFTKSRQPVMVTEFKHGNIKTVSTNDDEMQCLKNAFPTLPIFIVVYWYYGKNTVRLLNEEEAVPITHSQFYVIPINPLAKQYVRCPTKMTEKQWIDLQCELRMQKVSYRLNDTHCPYCNTTNSCCDTWDDERQLPEIR